MKVGPTDNPATRHSRARFCGDGVVSDGEVVIRSTIRLARPIVGHAVGYPATNNVCGFCGDGIESGGEACVIWVRAIMVRLPDV